MKREKARQVIVIIVVVMLLLLTAAANAKNLEYFGFYSHPVCGDFDAVRLSEYEKFSNVYVELCPTDDIGEKIDYLNNSKGMKPSITLMRVFFTERVEGGAWKLRSDYWETWQMIIPVLREHEKGIHSFYLVDEPVVHGITNEELRIAAELVKSDFPTVPILVVESGGHEVLNKLEIPVPVDYVAIDIYGVKNPVSDGYYQKALDILKSKMSDHQRIIIITDAWWSPAHEKLGIGIGDMPGLADKYYQLALLYPKVVGMFAFLWNADPETFGKDSLGSRDLGAVVSSQYYGIGCEITERCGENEGRVSHSATLDGQPWEGTINIQCVFNGFIGPFQEANIPYTAYGRPSGHRFCQYISGGPEGAVFIGTTPPTASQDLLKGGSITFVYNFLSAPTNSDVGNVRHSVTLNGSPWQGVLQYQCQYSGIWGPVQETLVPYTAYYRPMGERFCQYISGGPEGATFIKVNPSEQTLKSARETIEFVYEFNR